MMVISMKALALVQNGVLRVEERPMPQPIGSTSVLVRVAAVGVCGSDLPRAFESGAYHYPLVLGHEISGVVERSFDGSAFSPGDRVVVFPLLPDPAEPINQIGEFAVGRTYDYFGSRRDGGFQEYLEVPEFNLVRVPEGVDIEIAALTEPCAVSYHAVDRVPISVGMSAAVIGGGPIGIMTAQWLERRGCSPVIVSEPDERKRAIANDAGFRVIDPMAIDPVAEIASITDGGADVVIEACGLPATFLQAIAAAGLFGRVVFLGNINGELVLTKSDVSSILRRELTIHGTWNSKVVPRGRDEWTRVLAAIGGGLDLEPLVSHRVSLEEAVEFLPRMHRRDIWFNRVVVRVSGEAP
jgi:L-iditol 2-dehydrogenase/galactitol-1-phosphate 5-dehydrogenase